jgi:hypothetical protein
MFLAQCKRCCVLQCCCLTEICCGQVRTGPAIDQAVYWAQVALARENKHRTS